MSEKEPSLAGKPNPKYAGPPQDMEKMRQAAMEKMKNSVPPIEKAKNIASYKEVRPLKSPPPDVKKDKGCIHCGQAGHSSANCPNLQDSEYRKEFMGRLGKVGEEAIEASEEYYEKKEAND